MNARPPTPSEPDPSAEARRERLLDRQLQMLDRLAEMGMDIAGAIADQVKAGVEVAPAAGDDAPRPPSVIATLNTAAMAYGRAAQAVRMSLALQSHLLKAGEPRPAVDARGKPAAALSRIEPLGMDPARKISRVERLVRRAAEDSGRDREAAERLAVEVAEALEDQDRYGGDLYRPVGEIFAVICHDLGLYPDWSRVPKEDWVRHPNAAGAPGSPFAAGPTQPPPAGGPSTPDRETADAASPYSRPRPWD